MKAIKKEEEMKMKVSKAVILCLLIATLFFVASTTVYAADSDPSIRIEQMDGVDVNGSYKLVVTATASAAIGPIYTASIALSYDNTVIAPVNADTGEIISEQLTNQRTPFRTELASIVGAKWVTTSNNRTVFDVTAMALSARNISAGVAVIEFYFKLQNGKTIDDMNSSTFALEIGPTLIDGSAMLGAADATIYFLDYAGEYDNNNKELFLTSFTYINSDKDINKNHPVSFNVVNANGTLTATVDGSTIASGAAVQQGKSVVFTATPSNGCRVREWKDNGAVVNGANEEYTIAYLNAPHNVTVEFESIDDYNYNVYLEPAKNSLRAGDTLHIDVLLTGSLNYTQMASEIAYDTDLLEFAGYENLQGWAASATEPTPGKVAVRSVPGMNMIAGAPCSTAIRIVTLKFTVKDSFDGDSVNTGLSFASVLVSPPGGVVGTTTAPGKAVTLSLQK